MKQRGRREVQLLDNGSTVSFRHTTGLAGDVGASMTQQATVDSGTRRALFAMRARPLRRNVIMTRKRHKNGTALGGCLCEPFAEGRDPALILPQQRGASGFQRNRGGRPDLLVRFCQARNKGLDGAAETAQDQKRHQWYPLWYRAALEERLFAAMEELVSDRSTRRKIIHAALEVMNKPELGGHPNPFFLEHSARRIVRNPLAKSVCAAFTHRKRRRVQHARAKVACFKRLKKSGLLVLWRSGGSLPDNALVMTLPPEAMIAD